MLDRVLRYGSPDLSIVTVAIDGDFLYFGTSSGGGIYKLPYPALDSLTLLTALSDAEYVALSPTTPGVLHTFDRDPDELYEVDTATGAATLLATVLSGWYGVAQRPATGDLWLTGFAFDVKVFESDGTPITTHTTAAQSGGAKWHDDRLYVADFVDGFGFIEPDGTYTHVLSDPTNLPGPEDVAIHRGRIYLSQRDLSGLGGPPGGGLWSARLDGTDLRLEDDIDTLAGLFVYGNTLWAADPTEHRIYSYQLPHARWWAGVAGSG